MIKKGIMIIWIAVLFSSCRTESKSKADSSSAKMIHKQELLVFAAASLSDVLSEIVDSFEVNYNIKVLTNMASSGTLARQIEQGGTPDLYISASKKWGDYVDSLGCFVAGFKSDIAYNQLVLIAPNNSDKEVTAIDSSLNFKILLGEGRLSIGDPAHVPAGMYARQSLEYYGWYHQLTGKVLPAKDVRSALMVVEMEEAPLGIVYRTDAQKSSEVKILHSFPEKSHKPIVYVAGVCTNYDEAKAFYTYLSSNEMKTIWEKYGFTN